VNRKFLSVIVVSLLIVFPAFANCPVGDENCETRKIGYVDDPDSLASDANLTIKDTYVGGPASHTSHTGLDVIGEGFDISNLHIWQDGDFLVVGVESEYFNNIGKNNTFLGDLLITTSGLNDIGLPIDNKNNSETVWELAAVLANNQSLTAGERGMLSLYSIGDMETDLVSSISPSDYYWRPEQYIGYNRDVEGEVLAYGYYELSDDGILSFYIPWSVFGDLTTLDTLGFRWAMSCANDVIEGAIKVACETVPEPATLLLLGLGAFSGIFAKRKRA